MEPADNLAYIGRTDGPAKGQDRGGVYVATGDSGNGMTHGTIAGLLLADLIMGRANPWAKLYDPTRTSLRAIGTLLVEGAKSTAPYTDWLKSGDVKSANDIAPGSGALVRQGVHLLAVYRDPAGFCHARSAKCTHLGGVVQWNPAESSWDCPCHGSRFDAEGKVIAGPANDDLAEATLAEDKGGDPDDAA
jgi:Rieske Fe-S protein